MEDQSSLPHAPRLCWPLSLSGGPPAAWGVALVHLEAWHIQASLAEGGSLQLGFSLRAPAGLELVPILALGARRASAAALCRCAGVRLPGSKVRGVGGRRDGEYWLLYRVADLPSGVDRYARLSLL